MEPLRRNDLYAAFLIDSAIVDLLCLRHSHSMLLHKLGLGKTSYRALFIISIIDNPQKIV